MAELTSILMSMLPFPTKVLLAMELMGTDAGFGCLGVMIGLLTTLSQKLSSTRPLLLERLQSMGQAVGPMEGILMAAKADGVKRAHVR